MTKFESEEETHEHIHNWLTARSCSHDFEMIQTYFKTKSIINEKFLVWIYFWEQLKDLIFEN